MPDQPASLKPTRRDWFRLRKKSPLSPNKLGDDVDADSKGESSQPTLKPIEHPVNHDGMDLSQLPPMREAVLSADQVSELFSDIGQLGTDIMLMHRSENDRYANGSIPNDREQLQRAKAALLSQSVQRVQIRYRWQDSLWIDTLSSQDDGYRIVRIAHTNGNANQR